MWNNMAVSLIQHEVIRTTAVKAKELRRKVEPLITLAKEDTVANRRLAFSRLRDRAAVGKLFSELGPRFTSRQGGYTRILKAGFRHGDATMVAYVELLGRPRSFDEEGYEIESEEFAEETVEAIEDQTENADEEVEETAESDESTPSSDERASDSESK